MLKKIIIKLERKKNNDVDANVAQLKCSNNKWCAWRKKKSSVGFKIEN